MSCPNCNEPNTIKGQHNCLSAGLRQAGTNPDTGTQELREAIKAVMVGEPNAGYWAGQIMALFNTRIAAVLDRVEQDVFTDGATALRQDGRIWIDYGEVLARLEIIRKEVS